MSIGWGMVVLAFVGIALVCLVYASETEDGEE